MKIKIAGGKEDDGVVIGNTYDKYGSRNLIVKWMMGGFEASLNDFVEKSAPRSIHEIGCGEGYWTLKWNEKKISARGSDFSADIIEIAKQNACARHVPQDIFEIKSIYDVVPELDSADLVICCEVLEHLEKPEIALKALQSIVKNNLILSVPREPLWRALNLARLKYVKNLGNTPGHIQHWSKAGFKELISKYFEIIEEKSPLPWTMLLCKPLL